MEFFTNLNIIDTSANGNQRNMVQSFAMVPKRMDLIVKLVKALIHVDHRC